jgi:16S rRNA processing protein RimM
MEKNDFILIGKIVNVHGMKGTLKVYSYAESIEIFKTEDSGIVAKKNGTEKTFFLKQIKPGGKTLLLHLEGINNRTDAQELVGCELLIKSERLPQPEEGVYYWHDLIGLNVLTIHDQYVGIVKKIIPARGNDVYLADNHGAETLIPAIESVVRKVDIEKKIMIVDLPEGL